MKFVADLHLHSKYSRAVSQDMTLPNMAKWARFKGISVLATGDFTHPFWFDQLKNDLDEVGNGLYQLKSTIDNLQLTTDKSNVKGSGKAGSNVYFLLSCEISSIYSQGGKGRRIHTLFMFPSLESVATFNKELTRRGVNLRSDGRPIVGMSSRDLANIALSCDEKALIIPAHVWTPWFSLYGSFSGFDSVRECFGDMEKHIYGIETGLSSDPAMNWRVGDIDNRTILSFSDAHSLGKMGREATVFEGEEISYENIYNAIKGSNGSRVAFTIEFYPEEGKYHFDGHRDCNFSMSPEETGEKGAVCPVCKRPLTIGVMHRVEDLASSVSSVKYQVSGGVQWGYPENGSRPPYVSMVPLLEVLSEVFEAAPGTKKVMDQYLQLVQTFGSEFSVLMKIDSVDIARLSGQKTADAILKLRNRDIVVDPGYDGKFGVVKIFDKQKEEEQSGDATDQLNLFA